MKKQISYKLLGVILTICMVVGIFAATPLTAYASATDSMLTFLLESSSSNYVVKADGGLWAWGANSMGQLGDGTTERRREPVKILDNIVSVSVHQSPFIATALDTDNSLWIWGEAYHITGVASGSRPVKVLDNVSDYAFPYNGLFAEKLMAVCGAMVIWLI